MVRHVPFTARALRRLALALAFSCLALPAFAKPPKAKPKPKTKEDIEFQQRFATLKKDSANLVVVKMLPTDDPEKLPKLAGGPDMLGPVMVASGRSGIMEPETLSPSDILRVINKNMVDIRKCYKKQLAADPEWSDDLILDLSIKKTGRVNEVGVSPRRVRRDVIGECLVNTIPKWKFPEFTGESEDGVTQEVVNASFPFSLTPAPAQ